MEIRDIIAGYAAIVASIALGWNAYQYYDKKGKVIIKWTISWIDEFGAKEVKTNGIFFLILNKTDLKKQFQQVILVLKKKPFRMFLLAPATVEPYENITIRVTSEELNKAIRNNEIDEFELLKMRLVLIDNLSKQYISTAIPYKKVMNYKKLCKTTHQSFFKKLFG